VVKKYLVLLFGCASALSLSSAARAQTDTGLTIGAEGYYYEYDEPGFDRSSGPYGRVGAAYTGQLWDTFWTADLMLGGGVLDYRSGTAGNIDSYGNYSGELRLLATRDIQFKPDGFYLSLFTGLGYRVSYDDTAGTTSLGNASVDRLTQYLYWPLGFGLSFPITESVTFKPSFEYDFLIDGNVDVETGGVAGISNNLRNDLNSGSGYRIALDTEVDTATGRLSFGPFLRYWSVRVSDLAAINAGGETVGFAFEPISHTWEAGFGAKLNFGAPPPAPAPLQPSPPLIVPAPLPAAMPEPAREFQVFFDFNKSDLTGAARQVIKAAASTARAGNVVHLVVTGHTDTVGSAQYNQGLSERRAAAVKTELVADGLPGEEIQALGVGKTGLLVPTADGVREAQNRRATIEFAGTGM
jgi:outer membrane protein OmpA-like peptidoglycan-associated protein